jgi:hypothetical protein
MVIYNVFEWASDSLRNSIKEQTGSEALQYQQIGVFTTYKKAKKAIKLRKIHILLNHEEQSKFTIEPRELNVFNTDDGDSIKEYDLNDAS